MTPPVGPRIGGHIMITPVRRSVLPVGPARLYGVIKATASNLGMTTSLGYLYDMQAAISTGGSTRLQRH